MWDFVGLEEGVVCSEGVLLFVEECLVVLVGGGGIWMGFGLWGVLLLVREKGVEMEECSVIEL